MFQSLTIKCPACSDVQIVDYRLFREYTMKGFQCDCGHNPYYPSQKLFYYADILKTAWRFLPNNGFIPLTKCTVKYNVSYGLYVADFVFSLKDRGPVYHAIFKNNKETVKLTQNYAVVVFVKDDLDSIDFHEHITSDDSQWKSAFDFILLLKLWNREAFDFFQHAAYDLMAASVFNLA